MRDFKLEIEIAKKEIIENKKRAWVEEWKHKHPKDDCVPIVSLDEITPKAWFITQWGTGFIVVDYEELIKLPKTKRNKILSLGSIK